MNIDLRNFKAQYPNLKRYIQESEFIAIDVEFTGNGFHYLLIYLRP